MEEENITEIVVPTGNCIGEPGDFGWARCSPKEELQTSSSQKNFQRQQFTGVDKIH